MQLIPEFSYSATLKPPLEVGPGPFGIVQEVLAGERRARHRSVQNFRAERLGEHQRRLQFDAAL